MGDINICFITDMKSTLFLQDINHIKVSFQYYISIANQERDSSNIHAKSPFFGAEKWNLLVLVWIKLAGLHLVWWKFMQTFWQWSLRLIKAIGINLKLANKEINKDSQLLSVQKVSIFVVSLVCISPHSDWIRRNNTERWSVSRIIQSECGKIRTRRILNTETFCGVIMINRFMSLV